SDAPIVIGDLVLDGPADPDELPLHAATAPADSTTRAPTTTAFLETRGGFASMPATSTLRSL
ncbi:MAG TPA: hypothetical protein VMU95_19315, partial [Trebonia sp.]|nr:hypothetical protein [Trebonia sp.]